MQTIVEERSPFKKVAPVRIFEQAVEQIRSLIAEGYFTPGQKLPTEQELGKQLNVSRSSIREAFRVLEAEGLIEIRRGLGAFVTNGQGNRQKLSDVSRWLQQREESLEQVLQVRESIEGLGASLAAVNAGVEKLAQIRFLVQMQSDQIRAIHETGEENYERLAQLDSDFHLAISAASGNDIVCEIISHIVPAFQESNKAVLYVSKRMHKLVDEHLQIMAALEAHDSAKAEETIRLHLSHVRKELLELRNQNGGDPTAR